MAKSVYALTDPRDGTVRYIGCSSRLSNRLGEHRYAGKTRGDARAKWVGELLALGLSPALVVLEPGVEQWEEAERRWIAEYRAKGAALLNEADGGRGSRGVQMSEGNKEARRQRMLGNKLPQAPWTEERRRKLSDATRGKPRGPMSEQRRRSISESLKGRRLSDEHRLKLSEANANPTEETREKLRKAIEARPPELQERFTKANKGREFSPEHRANMAEAARRRWARTRKPAKE